MPPTPVTPVAKPKVTWTSDPSVKAWLTIVAAQAVAVISLVHPGFHEPSTLIPVLIPAVAELVSGAVVIVERIFHI